MSEMVLIKISLLLTSEQDSEPSSERVTWWSNIESALELIKICANNFIVVENLYMIYTKYASLRNDDIT